MLIVRDDTPGPRRSLRCPGPTEGQPTDAPLSLDPFTPRTVSDSGFEAIGCWLRPGQASDLDPVFFASGDGGFMVIDGEAVALPNSTPSQNSVIPTVEVDLSYSGDGYSATFVAVGPERRTSSESDERDVTLAVSTPAGRRTQIDGVLGCGV